MGLVERKTRTSSSISKNTALRPVASCSPRLPDVPGTYNVNSSSACFCPGSFCLGAAFFRPDAPGAPWRSLPSNHTPSAKPLPPAAPEAPVRLPPSPEAFRPRFLSSQTRPVPSHDTPSPSEPLPNPPVLSPFSPLSSRRFPTPLFVAHYPPHPSRPPDVLCIRQTFSVFAGRSPTPLVFALYPPHPARPPKVLPSAERFYRQLKVYTVRRRFLPSAEGFYCLPKDSTVRRRILPSAEGFYRPPKDFTVRLASFPTF